jgi:MAGE family
VVPTKFWILTSTLSNEIRGVTDLGNPEDQNDAIYQGLITAIVSLIYVHNGILPQGISSPDT